MSTHLIRNAVEAVAEARSNAAVTNKLTLEYQREVKLNSFREQASWWVPTDSQPSKYSDCYNVTLYSLCGIDG